MNAQEIMILKGKHKNMQLFVLLSLFFPKKKCDNIELLLYIPRPLPSEGSDMDEQIHEKTIFQET